MSQHEERFNQMAEAMNEVAVLSDNPHFIEFIYRNRIESAVQYEQDHEKRPFCVDTSLMHTLSPDDFLGEPLVVVQGLRLESTTSEKITVIRGEATLNQTKYAILYNSEEHKVLFYERDHVDLPPAIELNDQQLTEFILSGLMLHHSSDIDLEDVFNVYEQALSENDKIPSLIHALGSVNGSSTQSTTALINSDERVLAVKLTEKQNPTDIDAEDTLSLYDAGEIFTDTSHIVNQQHTDRFDSKGRGEAEYALRGIILDDPGRAALSNIINGLDKQEAGLVRYESSGDSEATRKYALACMAFLAVYQRAVELDNS